MKFMPENKPAGQAEKVFWGLAGGAITTVAVAFAAANSFAPASADCGGPFLSAPCSSAGWAVLLALVAGFGVNVYLLKRQKANQLRRVLIVELTLFILASIVFVGPFLFFAFSQ